MIPSSPLRKSDGSAHAWIDLAPTHWERVRLKNVASFNPPKSELGDLDRETLVSFVPMDAIGEDGSLAAEQTKTLQEVETGYTYFREHDVVVAKITPCFENGKGAIMRGLLGGIGFGTTELIVARPILNRCRSDFLFWFFSSSYFRSVGESSMYGAGGQKRVPDDFVKNLQAAMPPVREQAAIATFLDRETSKIDALVSEQRRLIALLKEKRQAVISHAVTKGLNPAVPMKPSGIPWLGDVPEHWEVQRLKRSWTVTDCKHVTAEFADDGIPLASIREVQRKWVDLDQAKRTTRYFYELLTEAGRDPRPGDLIFSRNATVGEVAQVGPHTPQFAMGQDVCLLRRLDAQASPNFWQHLLQSTSLVEQMSVLMVGATFKRINVDEIRNLWTVSPSAQEQREIADFLEREAGQFDTLVAQAENAIVLLQERRTALISAAVTGKIDVREEVEEEVA